MPTDDDKLYYIQRLVDHVPALLAYWDSTMHCRFANQAYKVWFGIDGKDMVGMSMQTLLGPALFEKNRPYIEGVLNGQEQFFERVVPGPDGVMRHSLAHYVPDIVDGVVKGFLVQVSEVTKLKEAEAALRASEAFLDRTGRIARVGGWELDLPSQRVTWSAQTYRIMGVEPDFVPTREAIRTFIDPAYRTHAAQLVEECMAHGGSWDTEYPITTGKGEHIWVRSFGEAIFQDGRAVRITGAVQDITERIQHRTELAREQAMRAQLERQAETLRGLLTERGDMLDVLAHEVRQPLHNASAALQSTLAALETGDEQVAKPRLVRAQKVMSQVMASIDNTLAVAALLARADPIDREDIDIDTLVAVAIGDMPASERHRIQIQRITTTRTAFRDMNLMRLALRNLLANALRYSPEGSPIVVRLHDSDQPLALIVEVENTGRPIPADLVPVLFERGTRGKHAGSNRAAHGGHGLGLYIVKRVMELHGGRVELAHNTDAVICMRLVVTQADD
jgi:PAS domain S-box-containing protein